MYALSPQTEYTGAIVAILDELKKEIEELKALIAPIPSSSLKQILFPDASDPNCRSISTILAHVISSGINYSLYIRNHLGEKQTRTQPIPLDSSAENQKALNRMFQANISLFQDYPTIDLMERFTVPWGQDYDVEQLMEHAIVHVGRHRRQIKRILQETRSDRSPAVPWPDATPLPTELLLEADPSLKAIEAYRDKANWLGIFAHERPVGICGWLSRDPHSAEIVNVAVVSDFRGSGLGKELILTAEKEVRQRGHKTLQIATANSSLSQLKLYQQLGFRIKEIQSDHFTKNYPEPMFENGLAVLDQLILIKNLATD